MDSINKGLNRLGFSIYPQKKPFESFQETLPKSEEEQIDEIMAQAKDQVAFEQQFGNGPGTSTAKNDLDSDEEADASSISDTDDDLKLDDDQLALSRIRRRVVKVQTKLEKLVALLDEASAAKKAEDKDDASSDSDDIRKPMAEDYLASGKKELRRSRQHLKKATEEWKDSLL